MELFETLFHPEGVYHTIFFNVKAVLQYPNLDKLLEENPKLYKHWQELSQSKFGDVSDRIYWNKAIYYPEFTKVVAITYAVVYLEKGQVNRMLKKIVGDDEYLTLETFMDTLRQFSTDGNESSPKEFPKLCGYGISNYDIPMLLKRYLSYRENFKDKKLPLILKNCLNSKPWDDSSMFDIANAWKFNGIESVSLTQVSDFLGLKKGKSDLDNLTDISINYWNLFGNGKTAEAQEYVAFQSAIHTNYCLQFMYDLRQF